MVSHYEVVIIGGSFTGLSAANVLGRMRCRVLLIDSGTPRNAPSPGLHNFLSREGTRPSEILAIAREQLSPYKIKCLRDEVTAIRRDGTKFDVSTKTLKQIKAKYLLIATGVYDELPAIPGLDAKWGVSALHCPYCHGWEIRDKRLAVLASGDEALELCIVLHTLSKDIVLCTNGLPGLDTAHKWALSALGVEVLEGPVTSFYGEGNDLEFLTFSDRERLERDIVFLRPTVVPSSALATQLGCDLDPEGFILVDEGFSTSVPHVFAAGDATLLSHKAIMAASSGVEAALAIHRKILETNLRKRFFSVSEHI